MVINAELFKKQILNFFESLRVKEEKYGCYRYAGCQKQPVLYASCYAALTRYLLGDLERITSSQKLEWISYIQTFQAEDGFFKDPLIAHPGSWYVPPHMEWCGWWHLSCHAIMALSALGGVAAREFTMLKPFYNEHYLVTWLEYRDFGRIDLVGNEVLNLGQLLQYARDFQSIKPADKAMEIIFDWLDRNHDPDTGMWGKEFITPEDKNKVYQGAYHFYLLYEYEKRKICYKEQIIDFMLSMQTEQGGFGIHTDTTGCEDIDAIDPLARLYFHTDYRHSDIKTSLNHAFDWVLMNRTPDKGFAFIRNKEMFYGSKFMCSGRNEGSTFATWWRILSIAIMSQVVIKHELAKIHWQFLHCPGYQFWKI